MSVLGRDVRTSFATRLAGRLYSATLTRVTTGAVDPDDAAGPPDVTEAVYACEGAAFGYGSDYVPGEKLKLTDYRVMILLGSLELVGDDAVQADLDLGDETSHVDVVVRAVDAGAAGNGITVELVGDASDGAGAIVVVGTNVRISFQPTVSTVADVEALVATAQIVEVETPGTAGNVLDAGDELAATPLSGGTDSTNTPAPDVIPQIGDRVSIPPPGQTSPATATLVELHTMTNAAVTFRVEGTPG